MRSADLDGESTAMADPFDDIVVRIGRQVSALRARGERELADRLAAASAGVMWVTRMLELPPEKRMEYLGRPGRPAGSDDPPARRRRMAPRARQGRLVQVLRCRAAEGGRDGCLRVAEFHEAMRLAGYATSMTERTASVERVIARLEEAGVIRRESPVAEVLEIVG